LRAGDDEIQLLGRWPLEFKEHRNSSAKVVRTFEKTTPMSRRRCRLVDVLAGKIRKQSNPQNVLD